MKDIYELEKIQRQAAGFVLSNYNYTDSVTNMIERLGWELLEDCRTESCLWLFFKIMLCTSRDDSTIKDFIHN